jgi:hypothetical protein
LANSLELNEWQLLESFFKHWAMSLYDPEWREDFIPPFQENGEVSQGLKLLERQDSAMEVPVVESPIFHPLQADIPFLQPGRQISMRSSGISVYRYIVPDRLSSELRVSILTNRQPFFTSLVRVR